MHFSEHYLNYVRRGLRSITLEQVVEAINNPAWEEVQEDGRTRYWGYIEEIGVYIRVVVDVDRVTIITTYEDPDFRPDLIP
ncbi:MAG: hypothetical protein ACE5Q6_15340 [Dehalococcoidia bacterium]